MFGAIALLVAGVTAAVVYWLLMDGAIWNPKGRDRGAVTDAIRTGLTTAAGVGAVMAGVVAYRRQKILEDDREGELTRDIADATAGREIERAMHERYQAATAQLGHDNLTIRLAGVYALAAVADDWLARENRGQAQVCVDVLCSYLRTDARAVGGSQPDVEVRQTITRVIASHLQPDSLPSWSGFDLDFTGATFTGQHSFNGAKFAAGTVSFDMAKFPRGVVTFTGAEFSGATVTFDTAEFSGGTVSFIQANITGGSVTFEMAEFSGGTVYLAAVGFLGGEVSFFGARFSGGELTFVRSGFHGGRVSFASAEFAGGEVNLLRVKLFGGEVSFDAARFDGGEVSFEGAEFSGGVVGFRQASLVSGEVRFTGARFDGGEVSFDAARFAGGRVTFDGARLIAGVISGPWPESTAPLPEMWPPAKRGDGSC